MRLFATSKNLAIVDMSRASGYCVRASFRIADDRLERQNVRRMYGQALKVEKNLNL